MISYDAIVTEVTARLGNRTDVAARIGRWVNYSLFELMLNPRYSFFELDQVTQTTGQPVRYFRYGMAVTFDPIPDAVYTIQMRYRTRPGDFASGSDLILGTEWEEPVVALATIRGFEALDMRNKAAEQRQLLESLMGTRMDVPTLEDADAEPTVQPTLIFPSY